MQIVAPSSISASGAIIRLAKAADASAIAGIIEEQSHHFVVDDTSDDARLFRAAFSTEELRTRFSDPGRLHAIAELGNEVVGIIVVRDNNYVSQFFVATAFQRRGIGSKLWRFALEFSCNAEPPALFNVDSSVIAQPVYEAFGFSAVGPIQIKNGFRYIPMQRPAPAAA